MRADAAIDLLLAKQEIRDVLSRYCRGLDRMDKEMARAVWHDGGTADYGMFEGTGHAFVEWVWTAHAGMKCHSHQITNVLIDVDGDLDGDVDGERATSEAYVTVMLWPDGDPPDRQTEIVSRGRYLDRWSRRDGRWAVDHRTYVTDAQSVREVTRADVPSPSARDGSDPSYQLFSKGSVPKA